MEKTTCFNVFVCRSCQTLSQQRRISQRVITCSREQSLRPILTRSHFVSKRRSNSPCTCCFWCYLRRQKSKLLRKGAFCQDSSVVTVCTTAACQLSFESIDCMLGGWMTKIIWDSSKHNHRRNQRKTADIGCGLQFGGIFDSEMVGATDQADNLFVPKRYPSAHARLSVFFGFVRLLKTCSAHSCFIWSWQTLHNCNQYNLCAVIPNKERRLRCGALGASARTKRQRTGN